MKPGILRCAITDRTLFSGDDATRRDLLIQQAARLATEGIDILQLREKDLPVSELAALARTLLQTIRHSSTRLVINARADVAVAVRAHGVHLTSAAEELTPRQVHSLYVGAGLAPPVITVSGHSLEDIIRHRQAPPTGPVSAILFGPIFEKSVSGHTPIQTQPPGSGLLLLKQACAAAAPIPVLALGGVTPATIDACLHAGAGGIAGIRLFHRA